MDGYGPVVMTYLQDQQILAACGTGGEDDDRSCYQLTPDKPEAWQGMPNLNINFCSHPTRTMENYIGGLGWLITGQEDCGGDNIATSLLTTQAQWIQPPIASPYTTAGFPAYACSVAINSSAVIITGGVNAAGVLSSTWMLDLTDYAWTKLEDMPGPRLSHGCTMTSTGELMIAGGYNESDVFSVYTYNLMNSIWTQAADLPAEMNSVDEPAMLLWNGQPIILEDDSSNIWILQNSSSSSSSWVKMSSNLDSDFLGSWATATLVPSGMFTCG